MTNRSFNTATQLLTSDMTEDVKETVRKLMRLAPGGNRLNTNEATDLAVYSMMNDLNPFNGEAYNLPGVGPIAGIYGYRRKANEWLAANYGPTERFWCEFTSAPMGAADFDPEVGDIAYICTLHDSVSKREWEQSTLGVYMQLRQGDMNAEKAWEEAQKFVGAEPTWEAVGVVDHREKFADTDNPRPSRQVDKWDRHERAKKRAEKWAIRKRFPSTIIPDIDLDDEVINSVATEVMEELDKPKRSEVEIIKQLGYGAEPDQEFAEIAKQLKWSKEETASVLKTHNGDYMAALEAARKQLPPE